VGEADKDAQPAVPSAPEPAPSPGTNVTVNVSVGATPGGAAPGGIDLKLVGLCVALWVVAAVIVFVNWRETTQNYYWGNVKQALDAQQPHFDLESMAALAAQGDEIVPSCQYELAHHWDQRFRCAVLRVLERVPTPKAHDVILATIKNDVDARVRANALMVLKTRVTTIPAEKEALITAAKAELSTEPELMARVVAATILGENGDKSPPVLSLLVFGIRTPELHKDSATALAAARSDAPPLHLEASPKQQRDEIMAIETWATANAIAPIVSPLVAQAEVAPQGSK
jgi:hypothetical protein